MVRKTKQRRKRPSEFGDPRKRYPDLRSPLRGPTKSKRRKTKR